MASNVRKAGSYPSWLRRRQNGDLLIKIGVYILLLLFSAIFIIPFLWMVSTAFKPVSLIYKDPPVWIPDPITFQNFVGAWRAVPFPRFVGNTLLITLSSVVGTLLSSSLVGFGFARFSGRGKRFLFILLLATMMIPGTVTLIPKFILFSRLNWVNSFLPLIVPNFFAAAFYVFMFRQFFQTIPGELYDSAELDGCNPLGLYWHIALPLSKPVLATAAIFVFLGSWNDFIDPLIYINSLSKFTLALGISLFKNQFYTQLQYMMPVSLLAMLPVLIIFFIAQKYFVQGIVTTGMKS